MLGRSHRFHGHRALNGVYKHGSTIRSSSISLRYGPRGPGKPYRAAVVVSRKTSKSAVVRNRIRRRIYAVIREISDRQDSQASIVRPGTDLVFTVYSDKVAEMPPAELRKAVADLLEKAAAEHR